MGIGFVLAAIEFEPVTLNLYFWLMTGYRYVRRDGPTDGHEFLYSSRLIRVSKVRGSVPEADGRSPEPE